MNQCFGVTRLFSRCKRKGYWRFFCADHRKLPWVVLGFIVVTAIPALASMLSWFSIAPADVVRAIDPPQTTLEEVVQSAAVEGVRYTVPSSEMLVAKVVTRANLERVELDDQNYFLFSLVSPFLPSRMDVVFRGDGCRFMGKGKRLSENRSEGYIDIVRVSCVDDRGIAYELGSESVNRERLGFVTNLGSQTNDKVAVVRDENFVTLRQGENVIVRFDKPIEFLPAMGRVR